MRISARIAATLDLLTHIAQTEAAADRAFEQWARANRYAGSKDRRFIREFMYVILRHRRYLAALMDDAQWRSCAIAAAGLGWLPDPNAPTDLDVLFDGTAYGAAVLSAEERQKCQQAVEKARANPDDLFIRHSIPAWAEVALKDRFAGNLEAELSALNDRAPLDLRVNQSKATRAEVQASLAEQGIESEALGPLSLTLTPGASLANTKAFQNGWVEVQDRGAQFLSRVSHQPGDRRILDFCAGAGGKSLHMADLLGADGQVYVHDASPERLTGLWPRQRRAGYTTIFPAFGAELTALELQMDLVVVDAPCSGSGRWRRNPETKWQFNAEKLQTLCDLQGDILRAAAPYVRAGGRLAYMTCSLFEGENQQQIQKFLDENPEFEPIDFDRSSLRDGEDLGGAGGYEAVLSPFATDSDGFYVATLTRRSIARI